MKRLGSFSFVCPRKLFLGLVAVALAGAQMSFAQSRIFEQLTPDKLVDYDVDVGHDTVPMFTFSMPASTPDYFEPRERLVPKVVVTASGYVSDPPPLKRFRVVITQPEGMAPIGVLLMYRETELVAAVHVAGSKLDSNSKEVAPSVVGRSTAFEFSISPEQIGQAKFEIVIPYPMLTIKGSVAGAPDRVVGAPRADIYWFYVKDFLPKK